jgi:Sulfotransferase domain
LAEFAIVGLGRRQINFYGRGLAMTLKVIGAGFGRTGTWSTKAALNELGLPCYHMSEIILNKENKSHLNFWRKVANSPPGATQDWQQVFAKYQATVDNPGCCVWRELPAAYPGAKVLLTLHPRGAEAWYESTIDTIYFTENMWQFKVLEWLTPFGRKFGDMSRKLIWERSLQGTMSDKAKAIARYNAYADEVKAAVPAEKLLVFKVDQGWAPLCAFLGVPQPATEFPNMNDRAAIKKTIGDVIKGMYIVLAGYAVAAAVVIYGLYRLLL